VIELAQIILNPHIQANEFTKIAEDVTNKLNERVKFQHRERHGESSNSVESTGRECGRKKRETQGRKT